MQKIRRWYQGGPELDLEIDARFGELIESALNGGLRDWRETARGQLALVIVLDQLTRNVHRGTARAHAGDARALALSLEMIERGALAGFSSEEQLFAIMPLVHAEDLAMQERGVELAERLAAEAHTEDLRAAWAGGAQRTRYYRDIIRRFGRFPRRNAALGRVSTAEELEFIRAEDAGPGPLPAPPAPPAPPADEGASAA